MSEEFEKIGPATVRSANGFTVRLPATGSVIYRDDQGEITIFTEWLVDPYQILICKKTKEKVAPARLEEVLPGVTRALEYLGHSVIMHEGSTWT